MSKMLYFQDVVNEEEEIQKTRIKFLEDSKPLFHIAMEYGCRFSPKNERNYGDKERAAVMTFAQGYGTIDCLALDLHLGIDDSITKDIGPILEELREHPKLMWKENDHSTDYVEAGWKGWNFNLKIHENGKAKSGPRFLVRAYFEESTLCEVVGTGKFEETKKVVCKD